MSTIPLLITKCLSELEKEFKEYGPIVEKIRLVEDQSEISDMWISPHLELGYNVKLCKKLKYEQLKAVVLHEIRHIEHGHFQRADTVRAIFGNEIPFVIHNIAMDLEINCDIKNIPPDSCFPKNYNLDDNLTYEEYFQALIKHKRFPQIAGSKLVRMDQSLNEINKNPEVWNKSSTDDKLSDEDKKFLEEVEAEVKVSSASRGLGKGNGRSKIKLISRPPLNISNYITTACSNIRNEKTHGYDLINYSSFKQSTLPDILEFNSYSERITVTLAFIVDVSGSRSDGQINNGISRIMSTLNSVDNTEFIMDLYFADTGVTQVNRVERVEDLPHTYTGRGGTAMAPVYRDLKETYDLICIMTDGYIDWEAVNKLPAKWYSKTIVGIDKSSYLSTARFTKLPTFVL